MTWLRVAEVADEIGVSARTVLRWVDRGELEALRLPGGQLRIAETAWIAWKAGRITRAAGHTLAAVIDEGGE